MNLKEPLAVLLLFGALLPQAVRAESIDYEALDEATKAAIKQACHGWIFQDAANWIASWVDAVSPLCDAEESARLRTLAQPVQPVQPMPSTGQVPSDIGSTRSWDPIRIECQNEYMCVTQRKRGEAMGRPVSLADYQAIADHCGGEYWCIEAAFDKLPNLEIPASPAPSGVDGQSNLAPGTSVNPLLQQVDALPGPTAEPAVLPQATEAGMAAPAAGGKAGVNTGAATATAGFIRAELTLTQLTPNDLRTVATYWNRSPVPLMVGPVELAIDCVDGGIAGDGRNDNRLWAGRPLKLGPGESGTISGKSDTVFGQGCAAGLAGYQATGAIRHLQRGITGYAEQQAVCGDGRQVPIVIHMSDESGKRFEMITESGGIITIPAEGYDARGILGAICGVGDYGNNTEFVAVGDAYLSRDIGALVGAWHDACRQDGDCRKTYLAWAAELD